MGVNISHYAAVAAPRQPMAKKPPASKLKTPAVPSSANEVKAPPGKPGKVAKKQKQKTIGSIIGSVNELEISKPKSNRGRKKKALANLANNDGVFEIGKKSLRSETK